MCSKLKGDQFSTTLNHCGNHGNYTNWGIMAILTELENLQKEKSKLDSDSRFTVDPSLPSVLL